MHQGQSSRYPGDFLLLDIEVEKGTDDEDERGYDVPWNEHFVNNFLRVHRRPRKLGK